MAKGRTIKQRLLIVSPLSKVFKALTEPRVLRKWLTTSARLPPRKGRNFRLNWASQLFAVWQSPRLFTGPETSLSWRHGRDEEKLLGYTRVAFELKPKNDGPLQDLPPLWVELGS